MFLWCAPPPPRGANPHFVTPPPKTGNRPDKRGQISREVAIAQMWAPEKAGVKYPVLILMPAFSIGYPQENNSYVVVAQMWAPEKEGG